MSNLSSSATPPTQESLQTPTKYQNDDHRHMEDSLVLRATQSLKLRARHSFSLDKGKHDEMRDLRKSSGHSAAVNDEGLENNDDDDDDNEFGVAEIYEAAVQQYLKRQESDDSLHYPIEPAEDEGDVGRRRMRGRRIVTASQLQAHIPAGLDKEKHEEIGDLTMMMMITGSNSKNYLDDEQDDDNEFGDAGIHDGAVYQYLEKSRISFSKTEATTAASQILLITPSQLQADNNNIPSALDKEKHEEIGDLLESGFRLDEQHDDDEFGDADENDQAMYRYLHNSHDSMSWPSGSSSSLLLLRHEGEKKLHFRHVKVTPSQLQAHLPSGLDKEKHEEMSDLINSSHRAAVNNREPKADEDEDDDDEFGDANENDSAVFQYLKKSQDSFDYGSGMDVTMVQQKITPSQLLSHIPSGLDKDKHDDISSLLQSKHSITVESLWQRSSISHPRRTDDYDDDEEDDDDEFGGAHVDDTPVNQYLDRARQTMDVSDSSRESFNTTPSTSNKRRFRLVRVTAAQLQSKLPSGLDGGRHEEIGEWVDPRRCGWKEKEGAGMDSKTAGGPMENDDDDNEFGNANDQDAPVSRYMRRYSIDNDDDFAINPITPSQLQARLPSGLDGEKHEDIGSLTDSRRVFGAYGENDDDHDEFGDAADDDAPVSRFMHDSNDSFFGVTPAELEMNGDDHGTGQLNGDNLVLRDTTTQNRDLDGGKHDDLGDLVDSKHEVDGEDHNEEDEFGKANDEDRPVQYYLDRWKDSFNDDQDYGVDNVVVFDKPGEKEVTTVRLDFTLDVEKHEDLGDFMGPQPVSENEEEDDYEFEGAHETDEPVQRYLLAQDSIHRHDAVVMLGQTLPDGDTEGANNVLPTKSKSIDRESHNDLGEFMGEGTATMTDDEDDDFGTADLQDRPNPMFLRSQVSIRDSVFFSPQGLLQIEQEAKRKELNRNRLAPAEADVR